MNLPIEESDWRKSGMVWPHPLLCLAGITAIMIAVLCIRISLPIGPGYWDISTYFDAAHRIVNGQTPNVDFQTPVGPLPYYLFAVLISVFPEAQPLLSTQWSIALIAIPAAAIVFHDIAKKSRRTSFLLVAPFIVFLVLPLNTQAAYPAPGFDGYGMYNRHSALLLYLLVTTILFCKSVLRQNILIAVIMFSLSLLKITGFSCGVLLVCYGLLSGRLDFRAIVVTALMTVLALLALEVSTGMISGYLRVLLEIAALNTGSFRRRYLSFFGNHIEVFLPLLVAGLVSTSQFFKSVNLINTGEPSPRSMRANFLDTGAIWMIVVLVSSIVFEIQNTGSQEFIYIWPAALLALNTIDRLDRRPRILLMACVATACVPVIADIARRAVQTATAAANYQILDARELGPLGRISARRVFFLRAAALNQHYQDSRTSYRKMSQLNFGHSDILTAEPDFQIGWLINAAAAVRAIRGYEVNSGRRFETIYTLDFSDPLPYLLGRRPIRFVQIGLDAQRTMPFDDKRMTASVASADAILVPLCPIMPMRDAIVARFTAALEGREKISLTPCWDMHVRRGSDFAMSTPRTAD